MITSVSSEKLMDRDWKTIKSTLDRLVFIRSWQKKYIKLFYEGKPIPSEEMNERYGYKYDPEAPLSFVEAPVLLECWLSSDYSIENWRDVQKKYKERAMYHSCRRFLEKMRAYPEQGALFNGLEEKLYRFLCPTRCRPKDYPQLSEKQFADKATTTFGRINSELREFLRTRHSNPNHIVLFRLEEWKDSLPVACTVESEPMLEGLKHLVRYCREAVVDEESELRRNLARTLLDYLYESSLSPEVKEELGIKRG